MVVAELRPETVAVRVRLRAFARVLLIPSSMPAGPAVIDEHARTVFVAAEIVSHF